MKKLNVYATVANINGKKSSGCEDYVGYSHWRALKSFEEGGHYHGAQD